MDIQEETEFPETLCVCVWICPAEAVVRTERLCGERLLEEDVFSVSLSVTSRDVYDSCCEGNIGRYGTIRCVHVLH